DIYSLGATFWYLLTGRVPFVGRTLREVADKQTKELPVEQLKNAHVPAPVVALLRSMLAVDPARRPQSARELLTAVRSCNEQFNPKARSRQRRAWVMRFLAIAVLAGIVLLIWVRQHRQSPLDASQSIAVLPFENLSSSADDAYFATGIQDEILTTLASIADLKVISRTSTDRYKSKPADLKTVREQLGVATIVEGSVQRVADKVRVNVQLIDTRTDTHLWANTYDRELKDVFAVESEISQTIANALQA